MVKLAFTVFCFSSNTSSGITVLFALDEQIPISLFFRKNGTIMNKKMKFLSKYEKAKIIVYLISALL